MTNRGFNGYPAVPVSSILPDVLTPQVTGLHYLGALVSQTRTLTPTLNRCYFAPAFTSVAITIDQLAVAVTTNVGSATHRLGVFLPASQSAPFALSPLSRVVDGGTVDCAGSTGVKTATVAVSIPAQSWFFLAGSSQTAAATLQVGGGSGATWFSAMGGNNTAGGYTMAMNLSMYADSVSGAFASAITPSGYINVDGGVTYRRAT